MSEDEGQRWPMTKPLHKGPSAYFDLAVVANGMICHLYEQGEAQPSPSSEQFLLQVANTLPTRRHHPAGAG